MSAETSAIVPLDTLIINGDTAASHKYGSDVAVMLPPDLRSITGERVDPATEGACISVNGLVATIRHPRWRAEEGSPEVTKGDVMLLPGINGTPDENDYPYLGTEPEGFVINRQGNTVDVADPDDAHPELFLHMLEEATEPSKSLFQAGVLTHQAYQRLWSRAVNANGLLYPGSNVAHRTSTLADIHPNPYVRRIATYMGGDKGLEGVLHYDCASFQVTSGDMYRYPEVAPAVNLFQATVSPLLPRFTASSFAVRGTAHPRFPEPYADLNPQNGWRTTRAIARRLGSPEGGMQEPLPTSIPEFEALAHRRMRDGLSPGAGRISGLHTDIRLRPEHKPAGAVEFCSAETNGGHIESNMAIAEMKRAYMFLIPQAYKTGRIQQLAQRYPRVVAANVGKQHFIDAEANSIVLAQDAPYQTITAVNGQKVSAEALWEETIQMLAAETRGTPFELSNGAQYWLRKRAANPRAGDMPRDQHGLVDMNTFYNRGAGTLVHYQKALFNQFIKLGFSEAEAISQVEVRTALAHQQYIQNFNPEENLAFLKTREEKRR